MGHPRLYWTYRDETLNGMLARMAAEATRGNFDESMWARLDLSVILGIGAHAPTYR